MQNTAVTFFQRMKKQPSSFQIFTPSIIKKENISNHSQVIFKKFRLNKFSSTTKIKIDNISICHTLNLNQLTNFLEEQFHR